MSIEYRPELASHPMARAARETNELGDAFDLPAVCKTYGLKVEDLKYIAEQRALRTIFPTMFAGKYQEPKILALTPQQEMQHLVLTAACMDCLLIGWRAREIQNET